MEGGGDKEQGWGGKSPGVGVEGNGPLDQTGNIWTVCTLPSIRGSRHTLQTQNKSPREVGALAIVQIGKLRQTEGLGVRARTRPQTSTVPNLLFYALAYPRHQPFCAQKAPSPSLTPPLPPASPCTGGLAGCLLRLPHRLQGRCRWCSPMPGAAMTILETTTWVIPLAAAT